MRVLVVDDEPDIRDTMKALLEAMSHEVRTAENGCEAVQLARAWRPGLVFMDVRMPVMDGLAATKARREFPETRDSSVCVVSAYCGDRDTIAQARSAGADQCFTKPIGFELLATALRDAEARQTGSA